MVLWESLGETGEDVMSFLAPWCYCPSPMLLIGVTLLGSILPGCSSHEFDGTTNIFCMGRRDIVKMTDNHKSQIISTGYISPFPQYTLPAPDNPVPNMRRGKSVIHTKILYRLLSMDYILHKNMTHVLIFLRTLIDKVIFFWNSPCPHWLSD